MPKAKRAQARPSERTQRRHRPLQGDIFARVQQSLPIARKMLVEGFDDERAEWSMDIPCKEPP